MNETEMNFNATTMNLSSTMALDDAMSAPSTRSITYHTTTPTMVSVMLFKWPINSQPNFPLQFPYFSAQDTYVFLLLINFRFIAQQCYQRLRFLLTQPWLRPLRTLLMMRLINFIFMR